MNEFIIYHNPRCSKSRQTLALLEKHSIQPTIVHYLDEPPSVTTLQQLIVQLGFTSARQLLRTKETLYHTLKLDNPDLTENELLQYLHQHPQLIERPIVVHQHRAVLGRPPENVEQLL